MMTVTTRRFGMALALLALLPLLAFSALAQEEQKGPKESPQFYRATIRVIELTAEDVVNSRDYLLLLRDNRYGEIRTGNSVPLRGEKGTIYMDVGLNIDCSVRSLGERVAVDLKLDLSNVAGRRSMGDGKVPVPITRKVRSSASTKVTLGKPTTIISVSDVTSESRFEVEVTVTKID